MTACVVFRKVSVISPIMVSMSSGICDLNLQVKMCSEVPIRVCVSDLKKPQQVRKSKVCQWNQQNDISCSLEKPWKFQLPEGNKSRFGFLWSYFPSFRKIDCIVFLFFQVFVPDTCLPQCLSTGMRNAPHFFSYAV